MIEDLKKIVQKELREKGYYNRLINYQQFCEIYKVYMNQMSEIHFAEIIGLDVKNFYKFKEGKRVSRILKPKYEKAPKELEDKIKAEIGEQKRQGVNYEKIGELHKPYCAEISFNEYARIIGISDTTLKRLKNDPDRIFILKKERRELTQEEKIEIINSIEKKEFEDYQQFLDIYELHKDKIGEREFAELLGISNTSFKMLKAGKRSVKVNLDKTIVLDIDKKQIRKKLLQEGYGNKLIDYSEFKEIYKNYKEKYTESQFREILYISEYSYDDMKYKNSKTRILNCEENNKNMEKTEQNDGNLEKVEEEIRSYIIEQELEYKIIDYEQFIKLYEHFKDKISQNRFSTILGVESIRKKGTGSKRRIVLERKENQLVSYSFKESKVYSMSSFQEIAEKYGYSVKQTLNILYDDRTDLTEKLLESLNSKGCIFIGKKPIDTVFMKKHAEEIALDINTYSKKMGRIYRAKQYADDIAQETILEIMQKQGGIVENLGEDSIDALLKYAHTVIKRKYISHFKLCKEKRTLSLDGPICAGESKKDLYSKVYKAKSIQEQLEENEERKRIKQYIHESDTPVSVIQICLMDGMERQEAIKFTSKKFGIGEKELMEILIAELQKNKDIKFNEKGEVYLSEKD